MRYVRENLLQASRRPNPESPTMARFTSDTRYEEALLGDEAQARSTSVAMRRWKLAAFTAGLAVVGLSVSLAGLMQERSALAAQLQAQVQVSTAATVDATGQDNKACTPAGMDMFANPTGKKQPCCKGLVVTTAPCRGDDMCQFCIPSTITEGKRAEYPPAKISVDPTTPKAAADKHKAKGMSLIFSDEFKDLARTKAMFVFEDIPYGVPGNTGDVNIVSTYNSDTVSLLPGGGMRLSAYMAPEDEKRFMQGWNGTWNSNYKSDVGLWAWHDFPWLEEASLDHRCFYAQIQIIPGVQHTWRQLQRKQTHDVGDVCNFWTES